MSFFDLKKISLTLHLITRNQKILFRTKKKKLKIANLKVISKNKNAILSH